VAVSLVKHTLKVDNFGEPYRLHPRFHCRKCGSNNVALLHIPGRVMGGTWVEGTDMSDCNYCGARTVNGPREQ